MSARTHRSTEATPGDRGLAFGEAQADAVANTVLAYRRLFATTRDLTIEDTRALGAEVQASLEPWPDLLEELDGIARGSGQDAAELAAVNARTEILAPRPECTFLGVLPEAAEDGHLRLAQNWDWHPDLERSIVVWTIVEPSGDWLTTLTEAGILAKIGLNSRRLGCCLNILGSEADGGVVGTPIHVLLRLLLQRCDSLSDAVELLADATVAGSSTINVGWAGASPGIVSVELSPERTATVRPEPAGWLAHTNHFLDPVAAQRDRSVRDWPDSLDRLDEARGRLSAAAGMSAASLQDILRTHNDGPLSICCHDRENASYADRQETLASIIMDLSVPQLLVRTGPPCGGEYERVPIAEPGSR